MDPNLLYWKSQGQSFFGRLKIWFDLLDPTTLLSSHAEIQKAHTLLGSGEKLNEKDEYATILSLSSVHADRGTPLPLLFRPPAFFPISAPLVVASLIPHRSAMAALLSQCLLQNYSAGFTYVNRNLSSEQGKMMFFKQPLLVTGAATYATFAGALPYIIVNRLGVKSTGIQTIFRSIIPIPLSAALALLSVLIVRSEEWQNGIQVFDSNGNPVGVSKAAGEKAVMDTALSRATLFGTTAAVPHLLVSLLQRRGLFKRNPMLVAPLRYMSIVFVLGLMIPISFSLFPQLGTIKRENMEEELQAATQDGQLYYHRGL